MPEPRILAVVPARGGSKGLPRKNLRLLAKKPLLAHTVEAARACDLVEQVVVTTDDPEIRDAALACGAVAPFLRPAELATDRALAVPTVQHALREMEAREGRYDHVVMLNPTSPLRGTDDIRGALRLLLDSGADGVVSIVDVGKYHPLRMRLLEADGTVRDYARADVELAPRQELPPVFVNNGAIYGVRRDVLVEQGTFKGARCVGYVMPAVRSVNIDDELDLLLAEEILRRAGRA